VDLAEQTVQHRLRVAPALLQDADGFGRHPERGDPALDLVGQHRRRVGGAERLQMLMRGSPPRPAATVT
jgi:hypothetical protein